MSAHPTRVIGHDPHAFETNAQEARREAAEARAQALLTRYGSPLVAACWLWEASEGTSDDEADAVLDLLKRELSGDVWLTFREWCRGENTPQTEMVETRINAADRIRARALATVAARHARRNPHADVIARLVGVETDAEQIRRVLAEAA